ncbi:antitoxin VbhA family protein [Lysobacter auxotrophicus]|uniref:Antitoxin VbhA domain-containing protein n=1 Tax=Lysobacter auxotrophicus TaxID=2992573 RepID=A0ABM8D9Z0_9GAMM|nr:antitoxin VbhA family protein [Lysobacter auxotrophicus]BDU15387.1 hypothetical protein LA521A_05880 [Lysobacter auxotrophicus]
MSQISAATAMDMAIASVEMEGFKVTSADKQLLRRVVAGELTAAEAMQEVLDEARSARHLNPHAD